jgi:ElaB/YqjD/DUF883 family membrane-anchored ribosome-binding protein
VAEDPGQVREELAQAREDLAGTMRELASRADVRSRVRQTVAERESEAQRRVEELGERLRAATPQDLQVAVHHATDAVRRNPAPYGAAAAGFLVGAVVGRRRGRRHPSPSAPTGS